ncbi:MAG: M14 family metallopeptidase, partial [Aquihabitans sp.]
MRSALGAPSGYHDEASLAAWVGAVADRTGVSVRTIGQSVEGRPIQEIALGDGADPDRPWVMVIANIHGCEVISSELAVALVDAVSAPAGCRSGTVLDIARISVVPVVNPDGRQAALRSLDRRLPLRPAPRRNANGVDLNRNWPWAPGVRDHWSPLAGTRRVRTPWYRGSAPLCEPETKALAALADERRPVVLLNLHSTGQIVTHPWSGRSDPTPDAASFARVAEAFVGAQPHWTYRTTQSNAWYPIAGASNDWFYAVHGTLALTVETGVPGGAVRRDLRRAGTFFWYANPDDP